MLKPVFVSVSDLFWLVSQFGQCQCAHVLPAVAGQVQQVDQESGLDISLWRAVTLFD